MELILYIVFVVLVSGIGYLVQKREVNKYAKIAEEGAPDPAFEMPSIQELRSDPGTLDSIRGKVVSIGYTPCAETYNQGRTQVFIEESFLVDTNGAIQTIERKTTTGNSPEVEENARWLASQLDVDFVN